MIRSKTFSGLEAYLEPSRTSMMDLSVEIAVNYFRKKRTTRDVGLALHKIVSCTKNKSVMENFNFCAVWVLNGSFFPKKMRYSP